MAKPETPDAKAKAAAYLVATGQVDISNPDPKPTRRKKDEKPPRPPKPTVPDSEKFRLERAARPEMVDLSMSYPLNLGPNPSGKELRNLAVPLIRGRQISQCNHPMHDYRPGRLQLTSTILPGYTPQPFGLLDFQDIALFLWPPWRLHGGFELEEQCLILKHRNSRLQNLTLEELVEVQHWMDESEYITAEGDNVNIREWRIWLSVEELRSLIEKMDQDLKRARSMMAYAWTERMEKMSMATNRSRKLAAMRRIHDDEDE